MFTQYTYKFLRNGYLKTDHKLKYLNEIPQCINKMLPSGQGSGSKNRGNMIFYVSTNI